MYCTAERNCNYRLFTFCEGIQWFHFASKMTDDVFTCTYKIMHNLSLGYRYQIKIFPIVYHQCGKSSFKLTNQTNLV